MLRGPNLEADSNRRTGPALKAVVTVTVSVCLWSSASMSTCLLSYPCSINYSVLGARHHHALGPREPTQTQESLVGRVYESEHGPSNQNSGRSYLSVPGVPGDIPARDGKLWSSPLPKTGSFDGPPSSVWFHSRELLEPALFRRTQAEWNPLRTSSLLANPTKQCFCGC